MIETSEQLIDAIRQESEGGEYDIVVMSDDYCMSLRNISYVRYNRDEDRIEIVMNADCN